MMAGMRTLAACVSVLALSGCSAIGWLGNTFGGQVLPILNGATGTRSASVSHFTYGPHARHKLDVYTPRDARGPLPVAVFFYGGYWDSGSRADYAFVGEGLASRGVVAVIPDYRIYPEIAFPAFVEDGALAVRWAFDHLAVVGGDRGRVSVMGHSAGARIAALLALDERYLRDRGFVTPPLAGFVGLAGPYDFLPFTDADVQQLMGPREGWPDTQPINFVDAQDPPALLMHGERDDIALPGNRTRMAAAIQKAGGRGEAVLYPELDHSGILVALAKPFRWLAPVRDAADAYMRGVTP